MSGILDIAVVISPVFLLIVVGSILRIFRVADDKWVSSFNNFGITIGFPIIIFNNILGIDRDFLKHDLDIFYFNIIILSLFIIFTYLVAKKFKLNIKLVNTFSLSGFFGNVAYIGYPVVMYVYPWAGAEVSVIIGIYVLLLFTIGLGILEASESRRIDTIRILLSILKNPFIIAIVLGVVFKCIDITLPYSIREALKLISVATSPLVLIAIGIFIIRKLRLKRILVGVISLTLIKLAILPLIFYIFGTAMDILPDFRVSIIESAMPLGITPFALAEKYRLDKEMVGSAIVLSTVLSVFTLPFIIYRFG